MKAGTWAIMISALFALALLGLVVFIAVDLSDGMPSVWGRVLEAQQERPLMDLDSIPEHVVSGYLDEMDPDFFDEQSGFFSGSSAAIFANMRSGRIVETRRSEVFNRLLWFIMSGKKSSSHHWKTHQLAVNWYLHDVVPRDLLLSWYFTWMRIGCGGIGLEEGARSEFGKPAAALTREEAGWLAMLDSDSRHCELRR